MFNFNRDLYKEYADKFDDLVKTKPPKKGERLTDKDLYIGVMFLRDVLGDFVLKTDVKNVCDILAENENYKMIECVKKVYPGI